MKKRSVALGLIFVLLGAWMCFGQYTGFDIEKSKPRSLFPSAGPGDIAIVNELRQTNRLLEQNNLLLTEQNRLLRNAMVKPKAPQASSRH